MTDKYFHCKANCEATQCGKCEYDWAGGISDFREAFDQNVKGDPALASALDQYANEYGRSVTGGVRASSLSRLEGVLTPFGWHLREQLPFRPRSAAELCGRRAWVYLAADITPWVGLVRDLLGDDEAQMVGSGFAEGAGVAANVADRRLLVSQLRVGSSFDLGGPSPGQMANGAVRRSAHWAGRLLWPVNAYFDVRDFEKSLEKCECLF